jgi:hypothetical protein
MEVRRRGYGKPSEVVNVRVELDKESELSGPERLKGAVALRWRV